jgi:hypothetical protein
VTIYKWIKKFTPIGTGEEFLTSKELVAIQKENLRLKQEIEILKKAMAIFAKKYNDTELIDFMDEYKKQYLVQMMCDVLSVPRSTSYHSLYKTESNCERENRE